MKPSTGLSIAATGAILAFAVHLNVPYVNPNAVGWVLILVGVAGIFAPPGTKRWLRQRLILSNGTYGPAIEATDKQYSRHLMPGGLLVAGDEPIAAEGSAIEEYIIDE